MNKREKTIILKEEHIYLRPITLNDVTREYVHWLNNKEVNKYLESRFIKHTLKSEQEYVTQMIKNPHTLLLAVIRRDENRHIGNIKLSITPLHHRGDIGIIIGDRASWGKGYATQAITMLAEYAFKKLHLHKLTAGADEPNKGSIKAFLKAGFLEEARRRHHFLVNGTFVDEVLLAKIIDD